jgi:hypothetical protein
MEWSSKYVKKWMSVSGTYSEANPMVYGASKTLKSQQNVERLFFKSPDLAPRLKESWLIYCSLMVRQESHADSTMIWKLWKFQWAILNTRKAGMGGSCLQDPDSIFTFRFLKKWDRICKKLHPRTTDGLWAQKITFRSFTYNWIELFLSIPTV